MPRPKGSLNKTTKEVRHLLTNILANSLDDLKISISTLPAPKRVDALIRIAYLLIPKVKIEDEGFSAFEDFEDAYLVNLDE
jgi:hypothetical protein